jgi:hypothetical protein
MIMAFLDIFLNRTAKQSPAFIRKNTVPSKSYQTALQTILKTVKLGRKVHRFTSHR